MSITTLCNEIAEKIGAVKQKGYDEGYDDGFAAGQESGGGDMSAWWDAFFANQQAIKNNYAIAGGGWNERTFTPNRTINAEALGMTNPATLFAYTGFEEFPAYLSDGATPSLDTSGFTGLNSLFANCKKLKKVHANIDLSSCTDMSYFLAGSAKVESVKLKHIEKVTKWNSAFGASSVLTDIGQENDDFGYFSASVDLSHTAIDFGTPKMSLCNLSRDFRQENSYLKFYYGDIPPTLTVSSQQYDAAQAYLDLDYSSEDAVPYFEMSLVISCGWMLEVV